MNSKIKVLAGIAAIAVAGSAHAWDPAGHLVVGAIADRLLKGKGEDKVIALLGYDLQTASTWADCVKSVHQLPDGTFKYIVNPKYSPPCTVFEKNPEELARMEDYAKRNWDYCAYSCDVGCHGSYHFADIAIQRDRYDKKFVGSNEHDVVSTINAAMAVLQGSPIPGPVKIRDKKEALLLLAHFVGDVHQPLHVGAVYLKEDGTIVDPDSETNVVDIQMQTTQGGNFIRDGGTSLHAEWDRVSVAIGTPEFDALVSSAQTTLQTPGAVDGWAATWASDSVVASHKAFAGLSFAAAPRKMGRNQWTVLSEPQDYARNRTKTQEEQLVKAGARLAQAVEAANLQSN